jgi:hypothetical protein
MKLKIIKLQNIQPHIRFIIFTYCIKRAECEINILKMWSSAQIILSTGHGNMIRTKLMSTISRNDKITSIQSCSKINNAIP